MDTGLIRGRYEPLAVIGRGGQGEVWRALDHQHNRTVAVKTRHLTSAGERDLVLSEARVLLALRPHPGLSLVREDFFEGDLYYLVMDWVEGPTLEGELEERGSPGLPFETVVAYLAQVADALDHLHAHAPPVIHRDVKPANLILAEGNRVVLVDFGLAGGVAGGSRGYGAPELAAGGPVTPAADVYGLAATAFTLLTGSTPQGQAPDRTQLPAAASATIERALGLALHPDPRRRPASAPELVARLRAWDRPLPEGVVTFVFTDVEGSTQSWERHPEEMRTTLRRHDAIIRAAVEEHGGSLVKSRGEGDSHFAVFRRPTDAVATACAFQLALAKEAWPDEVPIRVRVAAHTGEAELKEGEYYGTEVNRCARLRSIAWGGQTIVSQSTADLVHDALPDGVTLEDLGPHGLKDLSRPERVYQVCHSDLRRDFPPLQSIGTLHHNLPTQITSFVGREDEVARLRELLGRERLVTVTGAGGCGKTRLALQVGAEILDDNPDGVWLVELAPVADPQGVWPACAATLGVREETGRGFDEGVTERLRRQRALLVLDNCEHLVQACAELADRVLRSCPDARILATSREPLGITGEVTWRVPSLSLPADGDLTSSDAVRLFCERAARAKPDFRITESNAPAVTTICRRLDGIPLALELAAARAGALSVEQIADRLKDRFRLLTGGSRTALPRQQTLRAAVEWSYNLLTEDERKLLRDLSVFAGGFTLEAAEAVCARDDGDVLDLLLQLSTKSLVVVDDERYRLLETIRQFGRERLLETDDGPALRDAHRDFYLALAEEASPELSGPNQKEWLDGLGAEHDNLRSALEWSHDEDSDAALRLATALAPFWNVRGHLSEGRAWLERGLEKSGDQSLRSRALLQSGELAWHLGDVENARRRYVDSLAFARESGELAVAVDALNGLALLALDAGDYAIAHARLGEAQGAARDAGDHKAEAAVLSHFARVALLSGDLDQARVLYEESLSAFRSLGDSRHLAVILGNLGAIAARQGDFPSARELYAESLRIRRELGDLRGIATVLNNLGALSTRQGRYEEALSSYRESLEISRRLGYRSGEALALGNIGDARAVLGDLVAARGALEECLTISLELGERESIAFALEALARTDSDPERALTLVGAADALLEAIGAPTPDERQATLDDLRGKLAPEAFEDAWERGRGLPLEQAVAAATRRKRAGGVE